MKVQPVQKQTRAGQRTRFKAFVLVGDFGSYPPSHTTLESETAFGLFLVFHER